MPLPWVPAGVIAHQLLADEESINGPGAELIDAVHLAVGNGCAGHGNTCS